MRTQLLYGNLLFNCGTANTQVPLTATATRTNLSFKTAYLSAFSAQKAQIHFFIFATPLKNVSPLPPPKINKSGDGSATVYRLPLTIVLTALLGVNFPFT